MHLFIIGKQANRKRERISDAETNGMWPVNTV